MARQTPFATGKSGRKDVRQVGRVLTDYKRFVQVVEDEALRIMEEAAYMVLEATIPHTPLQFGGLRESGRAYAEMGPKGPRGIVTFGGDSNPVTPTPNAPTGIVTYALKVHEDLERTYNVGGPKFLENGGLDAKQEVDEFIIRELRKIKP